MFKKILIANRGEIACRIIRTATRLGIASVAVYSDADSSAPHVDLADEAWPIGAAPARDSYLVIERILDVALRSGSDAIHPGYGFLSESAEFAEACAAAGIVFIGPPPNAIRAMGSKAAAKALMERAGVPLVPGYHGEAQDIRTLSAAADRIGYPVLIKASAGGGGKGMRVVSNVDELSNSIASAKREAVASFGDDRVLIEKYLVRPRHIEVQVFGDNYGNIISLHERDCSVQRRYQKIIEEAPAPAIDLEFRRAICDAAVSAARAVGYVGAGTVEFISDEERFCFMEMNTRLQVEHPTTELVTGLDLVEWQILVAAGKPLPIRQDQVKLNGHAIEVRIYAEDPQREFLPSIGTLRHLRQPRETINIRIDTGVRQADTVTPYYDPMLAKLIAWGENRDDALRHLRRALCEYEVVGVQTNLDLLRAIVDQKDFIAGAVDTGFIARHADDFALARSCAGIDDNVIWTAAALAVLSDFKTGSRDNTPSTEDPWSPWGVADGWRMNSDAYQDLAFARDHVQVSVRVRFRDDNNLELDLPGGTVVATARDEQGGTSLRVDGILHRVRVVRWGAHLVVILKGRNHEIQFIDPLAPPRQDSGGDDRLTAPIPAKVTHVMAVSGDNVMRGAPLVVLEAMKMELTLTAPIGGTVDAVHCAVGDMVTEGSTLISFIHAEQPEKAP